MSDPVSLSDLVTQLSLGLDAVEGSLLGATAHHGKRVAILCLAMGHHLGYAPERLFSLAACALLHDNALTEYILSESTGDGRADGLRSHCTIGERNSKCIPFPYDPEGFILYHHEQADGGGPFGLAEGDFPVEAGLIALADRSDVDFRLQYATPEKLARLRAYIQAETGVRFLPVAVEAALAVLDETLLAQLTDDRVGEVLTRSLPQVDSHLTDEELIRISGLTAHIIDYKSRFTQMHTTQIANKAWLMGGVYGYTARQRAELYQAAALHDIGKLFIPTAILEKPGKLNHEEFRIIQSHVWYTWELLRRVGGFETIAVWAASHHEKLDGSGYPFGKRGDALDFNSRLLACLDIYQAVREERPYHPCRSHSEAMDILWSMADKGHLDREICADLDRTLCRLDNGNAPPPYPEMAATC